MASAATAAPPVPSCREGGVSTELLCGSGLMQLRREIQEETSPCAMGEAPGEDAGNAFRSLGKAFNLAGIHKRLPSEERVVLFCGCV